MRRCSQQHLITAGDTVNIRTCCGLGYVSGRPYGTRVKSWALESTSGFKSRCHCFLFHFWPQISTMKTRRVIMGPAGSKGCMGAPGTGLGPQEALKKFWPSTPSLAWASRKQRLRRETSGVSWFKLQMRKVRPGAGRRLPKGHTIRSSGGTEPQPHSGPRPLPCITGPAQGWH